MVSKMTQNLSSPKDFVGDPRLRHAGMTFLILFLLPIPFAFAAKDEGFSPLQMEALKGAKYVGSESCGACHEKEVKEFQTSTHARVSVPGEGMQIQECEMCHGPASLHVDASGGKGTILNPRKDVETCFQCHTDKKMEFNQPHHHPVLEGKMNCTSCHSPHGADVRAWSATTLKGVNETCFNCHKEQRGPF